MWCVDLFLARSRDDILASSYRWIKDGLACSAATHHEKARSIKIGFGMVVRT
jgi:hypothetical protein